MSYILEALRRADAERERGAVPGLYAQSTVGELEIPATRERRPLLYVVAGVGVLVVAIGAVLLFGPWRSAPAVVARTAAAPATSAARHATGPAADEGQAKPVATDAATAASQAEPAQAAAPAQAPRAKMDPLPMATSLPPEATSTKTPPASAAAVARAGARTASGPTGTAASDAMAEGPVEHYGPPIATAAPAPAPAPAAANPIKKLSELPPSVRSQLPNLTVGGAIYSDTPSGRMLILNGQVFHEGEKPAADTVLEQIRLKSAVLNHRGQRYEITF